jgi:type VI secretion system protein ImpM
VGFALFGKLPQKRDFIALGMPRQVLEPFETWLQAGVAASRSELGADWQEQYLVAPIWRFWIGRNVFGVTCIGAVMPSVDGVGRFFPLALMYCTDEDHDIAPPCFDPRESWFEALEARLLSVLENTNTVMPERLAEGLEVPSAAQAPEPRALPYRRGAFWNCEGDVASLLKAIIAPDLWMVAAGRSYWWKPATEASCAVVYAREALPEPYFFTSMIRGRIV